MLTTTEQSSEIIIVTTSQASPSQLAADNTNTLKAIVETTSSKFLFLSTFTFSSVVVTTPKFSS
jgi:hypothetical protein